MWRRAWPFFVVLAVLVAGSPTAEAAKQPPRAKLRANGDSLRLKSPNFSWSYPSGEFCSSYVSDGFFGDYGPGLALGHDHARPRLLFLRNHRPRVHRLKAYRAIESSGTFGQQPIGRAKRVRTRTYAVREDGEIVAWAVRFRVNVARRPYFDLAVGFPPRTECDGGHASYSFRFRRE